MTFKADIHKKLKEYELKVQLESENGCIGLSGPSGSGKSMILKCIAGIETPDGGRIQYGDSVFYDSDKKINIIPQKRNIGYMFQSYALFPNMTVEKNIACGPRASGLSKKETEIIVEELMDKCHITGLEKRHPSNLSGGQKQRVALARMLAARPGIILMDEPFSALDDNLRNELIYEIKDILKDFDGMAIYVSHNNNELDIICDTIIEIKEGRII